MSSSSLAPITPMVMAQAKNRTPISLAMSTNSGMLGRLARPIQLFMKAVAMWVMPGMVPMMFGTFIGMAGIGSGKAGLPIGATLRAFILFLLILSNP